jgi:acyl homoserine lactone synthase
MDIIAVKKGSVFFSSSDEREMYRLRYAMFKERLNWEVETEEGLEFDEYDRLNPLYVIAKNGSELCGCWRILPTTGPNMLRDTFPELLAGRAAPCGEDIWELSRFAVRAQGANAFGFSSLPLQMMLYAVRCGREQGITQLVTVTTPAMERLLKHAGLAPQRLGPALQVGVARAVALSLDTDLSTEMALVNAIAMKQPSKTGARNAGKDPVNAGFL